jgi:hypothetical protein
MAMYQTKHFYNVLEISGIRKSVVVAMTFLCVDCTVFVNKNAEHRALDRVGSSTKLIDHCLYFIQCLYHAIASHLV